VKAKPTLRRPCCLAGAGPPVSLFPFCTRMERREAPGACAAPCRSLRGSGSRLTNGVATPAREARRQTSNGVAKPAERALRLPALHRPAHDGPAAKAAAENAACPFALARPAARHDRTGADEYCPRNKYAQADLSRGRARRSSRHKPRAGDSTTADCREEKSRHGDVQFTASAARTPLRERHNRRRRAFRFPCGRAR
jgi:hypothetical protein